MRIVFFELLFEIRQRALHCTQPEKKMHQGSGSMASGLFLGLEACGKIWVCIYIGLCLLCGALNPMLHVTAVGLLLSALTYFKLPPPDPSEAFKILGCDPRNLDGTPR